MGTELSQISPGGAYNPSRDRLVTVRDGGIDVLTSILSSSSQAFGPVANTTFDSAIATANVPLVADYLFGSSAVSGGGKTAIANSSVLGTYFQNFQDFTGVVRINSELQSYESFTTAANYVFNTNNMQITGTLDAGGAVAPFLAFLCNSYSGLTASFTPANIGRADETGFAVGRIMIITFIGYCVITGVSGSGSGATITSTTIMGGSGANFLAFCPIQVMPYCYSTLSSTSHAGDTVLNFAAVPADVYNGMFVGIETPNGFQAQTTYVIQSHTATTVTISPALNGSDAFGSGRGIVFMPPIKSGQIIHKNKFPIPGNGATYFAMELTCQLPQNWNTYFNPVDANPNGAGGAWPAWWIFGGNAGGSYSDASEVDNFEFYNDNQTNMAYYTSNIHFGSSTLTSVPTYLYHPFNWTAGVNGTFHSSIDYSLTTHKFQCLITPLMVYSFIDGVLIKSTPYVWTSEKQLQVLCNMAIGSLAQGLGTNNLWPTATANFTSLKYNIYEIKFWSM